MPEDGPHGGQAPQSADLRDFRDKLCHRLARLGGETVLAGRISMIGLDRIKARLGPSWSRLAERADRIARATIERYLLPGDIFTMWQGASYVLVFAALTPEEARVKCVLIGEEIGKALLGEDGAEEIEIKTSVATLGGSMQFADIPSPGAPSPQAPQGKEGSDAASQAAPDPPRPRFFFRPMWDPSKNVISSYHCKTCLPSAGGYTEAEMIGDAGFARDADFALCARAVEAIGAMCAAKHPLLMTIPVHFETLSAGFTRREYAKFMAEHVRPELAQFLVIEILGIPNGVLQSRLFDIIAPLKPFCRWQVGQLSLEGAEFATCAQAGLRAVGFDLGACHNPEIMVIQQMNHFARLAQAAGLRCYVSGVKSLSLVAAAVGAGFAYIDGDAIGGLAEQPKAIEGFQLFDIYRSLVTGAA